MLGIYRACNMVLVQYSPAPGAGSPGAAGCTACGAHAARSGGSRQFFSLICGHGYIIMPTSRGVNLISLYGGITYQIEYLYHGTRRDFFLERDVFCHVFCVTCAKNNSNSIGIGSGRAHVGGRTWLELFFAPDLAHGAVETGRFSAFLTFLKKIRRVRQD